MTSVLRPPTSLLSPAWLKGLRDPWNGVGGDVEYVGEKFAFFEDTGAAGAEVALAHVESIAGLAEAIEPFFFGRAWAGSEGLDDLVGHFVMMIADVMEDEVGCGIDGVVGTK